jgi:hypothetical protein
LFSESKKGEFPRPPCDTGAIRLVQSIGSILHTISCRGLCLNYLKEDISTVLCSVGCILQQNASVCEIIT